MTEEDKTEVTKYLKSIDVRTMEFFEEMYDHIITSYQNRVNKNEPIKDHLRDVVQPAFGGVKGIQRVMKAQQKLRQRMIGKRVWSLFKSYLFQWPTVLITLMIALIIYQTNTVFNPKHVLIGIMLMSILTPVIIVLIGQGKFYLECKRQGKGYSSSDLNQRLMLLASFGTTLVNISINLVGEVVLGGKKGTLELLASYPLLQTALCLLFCLYALVTVQLLKEKFIYKLAI